MIDTFRPPLRSDPSASAYKDWFHLIFADRASGTIGLVNVSLHGAPWDERARAIGTVLVHSPEWGWISHHESMGYSEANLAPSVLALRDVAIAVDGNTEMIHASILDQTNLFHARLMAEPAGRSFAMEQKMPLGSGWMSWYVLPRMKLSGEWIINGQRTVLTNISAYHDHNWGRWHWGDNFGWEWGCFLGTLDDLQSPTLVFARTTNRAHNRGEPFLLVDSGPLRRRFSAGNIVMNFGGQFDLPLHRIPGAMAALHQEMAEPWLPGSVEIVATNGPERVTVTFSPRATAQCIAADPTVRGYGYIHEMVGEYSSSGMLSGVPFESEGLAVFEHAQ